jgi:isocitrate dehydrogenase kinase/phosphatase
MLLKNFGVTRHGRVVLYDYDELCPLTECEFRELPEADSPEQALAAQPWFDVGPNDVFPEQFHLFFAGNPLARRLFEERHADIYQPAFWHELQQKLRDGEIHDVFPYRRSRRFTRPSG